MHAPLCAGARGVELPEVVAGGEHVALEPRRKHDAAHRRVRLQAAQRLVQRGPQRSVQAVDRLLGNEHQRPGAPRGALYGDGLHGGKGGGLSRQAE